MKNKPLTIGQLVATLKMLPADMNVVLTAHDSITGTLCRRPLQEGDLSIDCLEGKKPNVIVSLSIGDINEMYEMCESASTAIMDVLG